MKLEGRHIETARWAMCRVRQALRNEATCEESEKPAQFHKKHCATTIISGTNRITPSVELRISADEVKPVIGVRIYFGGAAAVLVNLAYDYHDGDHRCNLAQDAGLKEEVYAYKMLKML